MTDRVAAFFDVDGTLVDSDIVRYGVQIRTAEMSPLARTLWTGWFLLRVPLLVALDRISRAAFQRTFYRLYRGLPADALAERAEALLHDHVVPRLVPATLERLDRHRRRGHATVLVTGSLAPIVTPLADRLGVDAVLAPRPEIVDGVLTGSLADPPLAGERKARAVADWADDHAVDLAGSYGYGDSLDDVPMLEAVGRPTAVNPDPRLRARARDRGWDVLDSRPEPTAAGHDR